MIDHIKNNKLGTVTVILSLAFMSLGLLSQVFEIWTSRSVAGVSVFAFMLLAVQSFFWVLYGAQKRDWFIITPNILGTLFAATIVAEYFWFSS